MLLFFVHIYIRYLVVPYEADAQMAYLAKHNIVDAVVTNDSDLIPFGVQRIIFKLDVNGNNKLLFNEVSTQICKACVNITVGMT